jgi:hypothetical protein
MTFLARACPHFVKPLLLALGLGLVAVLPVVPAMAEDHPLLTLRAGADEPLTLDLQALDALPQHSFETTTQWTEGKIAFSGPALKDVLALVHAGDASDEVIHLIAANHYEVILDHRLVEETVPVVATRINGKPFGIRDKGPLWVVFPYDLDTAYQSEGVFSASIWQLIEIVIER